MELYCQLPKVQSQQPIVALECQNSHRLKVEEKRDCFIFVFELEAAPTVPLPPARFEIILPLRHCGLVRDPAGPHLAFLLAFGEPLSVSLSRSLLHRWDLSC